MRLGNQTVVALPRCVCVIIRHEGPVWEVEWLHPKFGNILASCSYDRKVIIWKEENQNQWQIIYQYNDHKLSG
jgi:protein transport protein SEC13